MKPTVTRTAEDHVKVEMPNTNNAMTQYSVYYPDPKTAWVSVQRNNGRWAELSNLYHGRQIQQVLAVIRAAGV